MRLLRVLFGFATGNKLRLIMGAASVVTILMAGVGGYVKGNASASVECAANNTASFLKGEKQYEETRKDTMRLSPDNLDRELSKWMRD